MRLEGLMTHFASAADYASHKPTSRSRTFERMCCGAIAQLGHRARLRASVEHHSGRVWPPQARGRTWFGPATPSTDMFRRRRGHAPERVLHVKPALTWKAAVLAIKDLPEGALVGYGGMFRAPHPMRIAVLAAGYADGIPHRLSNRGRVIARGKAGADRGRGVDGS